MNGDDPVFAARALRFLRTAATALRRRVVQVHSVQLIDADILQLCTSETIFDATFPNKKRKPPV